MPRYMLYAEQMGKIVTEHIHGKNEWEEDKVNVSVNEEGTLTMEVPFFYNRANNFIIIPKPLTVIKEKANAVEPSYALTIEEIKKHLKNNSFGIGCTLLGKGTTELHYVALYKEKGEAGKMNIFDSKAASMGRFLSSAVPPNNLEIIWGYITTAFRTVGLALGIGKQVKTTFAGEDVTINRLETQSVFDGKSCGLHASGALMEIVNLTKGNPKNLVDDLISKKNLDLEAEKIHSPPSQNLNRKSSIIISPSLTMLNKKGFKLDPRIKNVPLASVSKNHSPKKPILAKDHNDESHVPSPPKF